MADVPSESLSFLLEAMQRGEEGAESRLFDLVYDELHGMAHGRMIRQGPGHTYQTTALVNEAYLRLAGKDEPRDWKDRQHFFRAAAQAMRHILVDKARKDRAVRHGGDQVRVPYDDRVPGPERSIDLIVLDEVLERLAAQSPRLSEVVHYRFFLGMTVAETSELLRVSSRTVDSDWALARAWLRREMNQGFPDNAGDSSGA